MKFQLSVDQNESVVSCTIKESSPRNLNIMTLCLTVKPVHIFCCQIQISNHTIFLFHRWLTAFVNMNVYSWFFWIKNSSEAGNVSKMKAVWYCTLKFVGLTSFISLWGTQILSCICIFEEIEKLFPEVDNLETVTTLTDMAKLFFCFFDFYVNDNCIFPHHVVIGYFQ